MKKILGSILFATVLLAGKFDIKLSKTTAFIYEPILIELTYKTDNKKEIDWIKFTPTQSPNYEIHTLKKESPEYGYRFFYLLFPKKSGQIAITYNLQLKIAPFAEIQNKILGTGYEQTDPIEGRIETIEVPSSTLSIKPVSADLYGNFHLWMEIDATKKEAYEPIYMKIHLKGTGYPPTIDDPLPFIEGVKKLVDKPHKKIDYKADGAHIDYTFSYALITDHSFTIPSIKYNVFDFHEHKELKIAPKNITITPPSIKPDKTTSPKPIEPVAKEVVYFGAQLLIFLAGLLSGVILTLIYAKRAQELHFIAGANHQELLAHLSIHYPHGFQELKEALEKRRKLLPIKLKLIKELLWSKS